MTKATPTPTRRYDTAPVKVRRKLIEVSLPLEKINAAAAREKAIRHGHPSTLHLWWARRPLAAARAVIFSQLVDDPGEYTDELLAEPASRERAVRELRTRRELWEGRRRNQAAAAATGDVADADPGPEPTLDDCAADLERERLFRLIEQLVLWENTTNEGLLAQARAEIRRSWRRTCADNRDHPLAADLFDPERMPAFHDPFAGGGALPLEAQRLGLHAHASDLNPVAVLINKAMIEIPPRFAGCPPANPEARRSASYAGSWKGAAGLANDVRYYGAWMRSEAERRIGHLYPPVEVTAEMAKDRPDLRAYVGRKLTVIAWLSARTVPSPDPAMAGMHVPLIASYWVCKKNGRQAWIEPRVDREAGSWRFVVQTGRPASLEQVDAGTKTGRGSFRCLVTGAAMTPEYLHEQGQRGRIGARLLAVVAEGDRGRVYLSADGAHEAIAGSAVPDWQPETQLGTNTRHLTPVAYGYTTHASLFTPRQLTALDTFASLVADARQRVLSDARAAGLAEGLPLDQGGVGAMAYADAVAVLLGIVVSRRHDRWTSFSIWNTIREELESLVRLSAVQMTWEFAEGNPFSASSGNFLGGAVLTAKAIEPLGFGIPGHAFQEDARKLEGGSAMVVCTDPPYFDNIPYADLSDLFYVWLRRALRPIVPELMSTMLVPKADELVADPARHGSKASAERYFFDGMREVIQRLRTHGHAAMPTTIFYAFKQSESNEAGTVSTGWDRFLSAVVAGGFAIVGTWPMRTEQSGGLRNVDRNSLATSVVLCAGHARRTRRLARAATWWLPSSASCPWRWSSYSAATSPRWTSNRRRSASAWRSSRASSTSSTRRARR